MIAEPPRVAGSTSWRTPAERVTRACPSWCGPGAFGCSRGSGEGVIPRRGRGLPLTARARGRRVRRLAHGEPRLPGRSGPSRYRSGRDPQPPSRWSIAGPDDQSPDMNSQHSTPEGDSRSDDEPGPVRIQAASLGDLVALIPYLTGYRITEGLVVLVYQGGRIQLTASVPLTPGDWTPESMSQLGEMCHQFPDADYILVGFHSDPVVITEALQAAQAAFPSGRVLDVVRTDNRRYWSLTCQESCCPPEGQPVDHHAPAAVQAVLAGAVAEASREAIVARVSGPSQASQSRDWLQIQSFLDAQRDDPWRDRCGRLDTLLGVGLADPTALTHHALLELACLLIDVPIRDRAWLQMSRSNAESYLALWLRVIAVAPDQVAIAVICLAGLAAWMAGHGALLTVCVERGERLGVPYSLLDIVSDIQSRAVPPSAWDDWRLDLIDSP